MTTVAAPEAEALLRTIWREVLDLDAEPGPHENFFQLGGDSMLAVRVAARARSTGLELRARAVMEHQTLAELSAFATGLTASGDQGAAAPPTDDGALPLLPAQERWLDNDIPDVDYWNLDVLLDCPAGISRAQLESVARAMLERHEALATRYEPGDGGRWSASRVPVDDALAAAAVAERHLPTGSEELQRMLLEEQRSLSLADGRIFRLVQFVAGAGEGRLFVLIHHLTADGVSMSTVVDDLETALVQAMDGARPGLPAATPPRRYAEALRLWLSTSEAARDAGRWRALPWAAVADLPTDLDGPGSVPSNRTVRVALDPTATRFFTHALPGSSPSAHDAVLAAVILAVAEWTGEPTHAVDVYAHNRDDPPGALDLTRTVGYVQSTYPLVLTCLASAEDDAAAVAAICAQIGAGAERPFGYDALRYLPGDPHGLRGTPAPQIRHNFRGGLARVLERRGALLREAEDDTVANRSPRQVERYKLMIEGDVLDGRLLIGIRYSDERYAEATVRAIAERAAAALERLAATG